ASAADLLPALTPTLVIQGTSGDNGFVVRVTNYDSNFTWAATPSANASLLFRLPSASATFWDITVRNVPLDQSATLTITATRTGYSDGTASIVGYAKKTGITPAFGPVIQTLIGFSRQITNYDPAYTWFVTSSAGVLSFSNTGLITVSDMYSDITANIYVKVSRDGYATGQFSFEAAGLPMLPALTPTLGDPVVTTNTIQVQITNYDPAFDWSVDAGAEYTTTVDANGLVTISNVPAATAVGLHVRTGRYGYEGAVTYLVATTWFDALIPEAYPDTAISTSDGFILALNNYDPSFLWSAISDVGSATIDSAGVITVTGVGPGQTANVTVNSTRGDTAPGSATFSWQALPGNFTPLFGPVSRTATGYTVPIINFDPAFGWSVFTEEFTGLATIDSTGLITVTGLAAEQSATIQVITSRANYIDALVTLTSSALAVVSTPDPSTDGSDSGDGDIDRAANSAVESAEAQARARQLAEDAIRAKAEAKAKAEALAAAAAKAKLDSDLKVVAKLDLAGSGNPAKVISMLSPSQIALVPLATFKRLSPIAINSLTASQAAGLTIQQVKSMATKQLVKLTPAAVGSLKPEALGSLSVAKLKALTKSQVKAIWAGQLLQLSPDQKKALRR
ncbi:MAG: hypothetical protein ACKOWI_06625, partial [Rhodoluna sp.]